MIRHRHPIRYHVSKAVRRFGEICGGYLVIAVVALLAALAPKPR